jgi:hypothetical protein
MNKLFYLRGFVIPPGYRKSVKWVNDTPHLSAKAANLHRSLLPTIGKNTNFSSSVYEWLSKARVKDVDKAWSLYNILGPRGTLGYLVELNSGAISAQKFLSKMVMKEKEIWKIDPTLSEASYLEATKLLYDALNNIEHTALKKFENKAFLKYAGDANRRNFEEYVRQVKENYLPERKAFASSKLPKMSTYDWALTVQYHRYAAENRSIDKLIEQGDFLASARSDTFGGAPYYKNMADYVSDEIDDLQTYADLYDVLALLWLFLPPREKEMISTYYTYSNLERVQTGGISSFSGREQSLEDFPALQNKQRFVQAESAIFPRAMKAVHDLLRDVWKKHDILSADKTSEEEVTRRMKEVTLKALDLGLNTQGADYSNFDASIEICTLNDAYFNLIRMHLPSWFVYWIIDPYFKVAFKTKIFVPGIGLVLTTGIKSGMVITNQGDCYYADFCDMYEIGRFIEDEGRDPWKILPHLSL